MENLLTIEGVTKIYGEGLGAYRALSAAELSIQKGSINVIMGKSGSGKSTLLSVMGGMERPTNGRLIFGGKDFYAQKEKEQARIRGQHFGYVFQSYYLIQELTVYDNIFMPLYINRQGENASYIQRLAEQLDIADKLNSFPYQLSGGQRQRVAIARAMVNSPDILFADEPTGNLDKKNGQIVIRLLETLCKTNDQTLVLVTHDSDLAESPDQLFLIEDGRVRKQNHPLKYI